MDTHISTEKAYLSIENLFIIKYKVGLCIARQFFSLQPESHFTFFQNFYCQFRGKWNSYKEEIKEWSIYFACTPTTVFFYNQKAASFFLSDLYTVYNITRLG